jgi:hypothetical protein
MLKLKNASKQKQITLKEWKWSFPCQNSGESTAFRNSSRLEIVYVDENGLFDPKYCLLWSVHFIGDAYSAKSLVKWSKKLKC